MLFISKQVGDMDFDLASHYGQPYSLLRNAMQFEQHEWSLIRIEVDSFHFECELGFDQTRGWDNSNKVWKRVYLVLIISKSEACCNDQLCNRTSGVRPLLYDDRLLMKRSASQSLLKTV